MIKKDDYDLYFMNDSYDDEIISDMTASFRNRLYYDILKGKRFIQNNNIINGDVSDIVIDVELNKKYHMPENTYSLWLNCDLVPYYSEKLFLSKYNYETLLSSNTIMEDNKIFNKSFYFFINDYLIYDVKVVIARDESIIFIPITSEDSESDICRSHFENLMNQDDADNSWTAYLGTKADYYTGYSPRISLFTDNKIYVDKLDTHKSYDKPVKNNSWTVYMTYEQKSRNVMIASNTSLHSDDNGEYFLIDDDFKNLIYDHTTVMRYLFVNEPDSTGNGIYINVDNSEPIFQIPYKENPIPLENLIIWKYDNATKRKLHPMQTYAELRYPNIYDFTGMMECSYFKTLFANSKALINTINREVIILAPGTDDIKSYDLFLEWVEPTQDISAFDTYIQDYMELYKDEYVGMVERKEAHPLILNYKPIDEMDYTADNYFNSDWKGDYRAWRLEKIIQLLKDNPKRYDELFHKIYEKRKKIISKTFRKYSSPHIYKRSITDNKLHCDSAEELLVTFNSPQAYICIYNASCTMHSCTLYINGMAKNITHIMNYGSTLYIYFPISYIQNGEIIHVDVYLDDLDIETKMIKLNGLKAEFDFDEDPFQRKESLSNLVFFNMETNEYINIEDFSIELQIYKSDIQYIGLNKVDTISSISDDIELYENQLLLVTPTDANAIVLQQQYIRHIIKDVSSNKMVNLNNIVVHNTNNAYIDMPIGIATTNFKRSIKKYFASNGSSNNKKNYIITMSNFKGKPDPNRFRVYKDGRLQNSNDYTINFTKYDGDVDIVFDYMCRGSYIVEYIGYDTDVVYNGLYKNMDIDFDKKIIYLNKYIDTPFDLTVYQLYIDGLRIPNDNIHFLGERSIIYVNNINAVPISENSLITIFKQKMDKDPFEYEKDTQFLSEVAKDDESFRTYLRKKYIGF